LVVKELPDAVLELYGFGQEEENCKKLIKKLGLNKNVIIKGFTNDPAGVFSSAAFSMMTSAIEGYPLTLAESVCNGCPVFAFDIKYGPSDVINHNKTGFLFPRFNKELYAQKIISYLKDIDKQRVMSENCYDAAPKHSVDTFMDKWFKFTEEMYRRKQKNNI